MFTATKWSSLQERVKIITQNKFYRIVRGSNEAPLFSNAAVMPKEYFNSPPVRPNSIRKGPTKLDFEIVFKRTRGKKWP
jgi:hypothetical protein